MHYAGPRAPVRINRGSGDSTGGGSGGGADWADLPVFGRAGWKRYRFDQIAENIRENVMALLGWP